METKPLAQVLATYRDGDEHGWATEFAWLRSHHAEQIEALASSIREVGMHSPILLGSDGRIWDGHHRLCVADSLGLDDVPVERASGKKKQATFGDESIRIGYHEAVADLARACLVNRTGRAAA